MHMDRRSEETLTLTRVGIHSRSLHRPQALTRHRNYPLGPRIFFTVNDASLLEEEVSEEA